jgi:hypothetical protein
MIVLSQLLKEYCDSLRFIHDAKTFEFWAALNYNIQKLEARYPEKYTDQDAIERKDKI